MPNQKDIMQRLIEAQDELINKQREMIKLQKEVIEVLKHKVVIYESIVKELKIDDGK